MRLRLRPPDERDVGAIVALLNETSRAIDGVDATSEAEVRLRLRSPTHDPKHNARLAFDGDSLVGYADVEPQGAEPTRCWLRFAASPSAELEPVASVLFDWAERRSAGERQPLLRVYLSQADERLKETVERRGFCLVRHSDRMEVRLDCEPEHPRWPDGIVVRTVREGDVRSVWETFDEAFGDSWERPEFPFDEWAHWMLQDGHFDPSLWFLGHARDQVAGICLCRAQDHQPDVGWVSTLGVRRPWRRLGLGRALLQHALGELYRRGFRRAALGVDADSLTGANRLYESVGMRPVLRFDFYDKPIESRLDVR